MSEEIINKVAQSALTTLDLETYFPKDEVVVFDLKPLLFMEMIIKEKDFRASLLATDWNVYADKQVTVTCSADAIIPMWAYMLVTAYVQPMARDVYSGTADEMRKHLFLKNLQSIEINQFADQRIIIKGCGDEPIDSAAYTEISKLLRPVAKSILYGEACSNVPIYKKK